MELGIPYELIGPDGTRIVFGNTDAAKADADYVGHLDPDAGIAGLDAPEVRQSSALIVAGDGGIHYDFLHGRRPVVINGVINPNVDIATIVEHEQKIKRASNAMRADALLKWTNTGLPKRRLALRRNGARVGIGRRPKSFALDMIDADYRILSDVEHDSGLKATNANFNVENVGDEIATPRWELTGPIAATIRLRNLTTGLEIRMKASLALAAGETLIVDTAPPYPIVTVNGVRKYDAIDYLPTSWAGLVPGINQLNVTGGAGAGQGRVYHRDAWI